MKRFTIICAAILSLSLLAGCTPGIEFTTPKDEEFQDDLDEVREPSEDSGEDDDGSWNAWAEEWKTWSEGAEDRFSGEKAHRWRILDAEGQELYTVSDEAQVEALDDLLLCEGDDWDRLAEDPGEPAYSYVYSQEKTLLAGQDPEDEREYEDLLTFTASATEDVVTVQILGGLEELSLVPGVEMEDVLTFFVSVPAETVEALRAPERFSK